jgi:RNA polymerase sigma-70 factor (ECF subfamily)
VILAFIIAMTTSDNKKLIRKSELLNSETDQDILIKRAGSDPDAFARLYRLHYDSVFRYCARRLFNRQSAEDVTSTVFFKAINAIKSFKGNSKDFRNWLYRIATNAANDHLRSAVKRKEAIRIVSDNIRSGRHVIASDDLTDKKLILKQALLSLKPKYQTVIALRYFENMKLTEIAEVLDQKPATIRSIRSRALSKLRKKLKAAAIDNEEVYS